MNDFTEFLRSEYRTELRRAAQLGMDLDKLRADVLFQAEDYCGEAACHGFRVSFEKACVDAIQYLVGCEEARREEARANAFADAHSL